MKKKFLAAILAAAVMVTSIQLPAVEVKAATASELETLVNQCNELAPNEGLYRKNAWDAFEVELTEAKGILATEGVTEEALQEAYTALETVKNALDSNIRVVTLDLINNATPADDEDIYDANDRFQFPDIDEMKVLEMEYLSKTDIDNGWKLRVVERTTGDNVPSNGKYVDGLNAEDELTLYYNAPRTGVYTAVLSYESGSTTNELKWNQAKEGIVYNIVSGNKMANADQNDVLKAATVEIDFIVETSGDGTLVFTGGAGKAPRLDKMEITAKELDLNVTINDPADDKGTITSNVENDKVRQGEEATFTITPNPNYVVTSVTVNGESVTFAPTGEADRSVTATVTGGNEDLTVAATYAWYTYSENDPFTFPTTAGEEKILEMEWLVLNKDREDTDQWPAKIESGVGLSNGFMVSDLNDNDTLVLYYNAPREGTYSAKLSYKSGNSENRLYWIEAGGKIQDGNVNANNGTDQNGTNLYTTLSFKFVVVERGSGILTFRGASVQAPRLDCITITADPYTYDVIKTVVTEEGEEAHGTISGDNTATEGTDATFTITPDEGYVVEEVKVNGVVDNSVPEAGGDVTVSNVSDNITIEAKFEKEAYVAGYNAVLQDNILMKFHMKLSQSVIAQAPKVVIGLDGSESKEFTYADGTFAGGTLVGENYVFEYGVPAKDMQTAINVKVVSNDGAKIFFEGVYTVEGYTTDLMNKNPENTVMQKLVDAMLDFGDYANKYFDKEFTAESPELTPDDLAFLKEMERKVSGKENGYVGSSLLLRSETVVRHYFNRPVKTNNLPAGYTNGEKEGTNGTTFYYIESGIPAHELGKLNPITISTDKGDVSITFNPLSYAYLVINQGSTDEEMVRLEKVVRAMYLYYKAADAYRDSISNSNPETD